MAICMQRIAKLEQALGVRGKEGKENIDSSNVKQNDSRYRQSDSKTLILEDFSMLSH